MLLVYTLTYLRNAGLARLVFFLAPGAEIGADARMRRRGGSMAFTRVRVAVLMGGMSGEHEVSLNSGAGVTRALTEVGFEPLPITIGKDGAWHFPNSAPVSIFEAVDRLGKNRPDCVFIALHGPNGEDGRVQGMLDLLGLRYTGSGCAASALAMDKIRSKAVVEDAEVPVAGHAVFDARAWNESLEDIMDMVEEGVGYPCVVKTPRLGSSVGVEIVQRPEDFGLSVARVMAIDGEVMVEEFIQGREITCAVFDVDPNFSARALPCVEIRPKTAAFFDYDAKYTPGASEEIVPAPIEDAVAEEIQEYAVRAHEAVGCTGWSRSDFMLDKDGPVWIEINTVPGLTATSLFPQACGADGISYNEMVRMLVDAALCRP